LRDSDLDLSSHPPLEQAYFDILNEVRTREQALLAKQQAPGEVSEPQAETAPVDEISDVNLYAIEVDPHLRELVSEDLLAARFDIPVVINDSVLKFLNFYQTRGRRIMEIGLQRSGKYMAHFRRYFEDEGIPLDLVWMALVESMFNPHARSRARAVGIWQFLRGTGRIYGLKQNSWVDERVDFLKSAQAAARYLKDLHAKFGDWYLALAAYNGGPGRVDRVLKRRGEIDYWEMVDRRLLPRETSKYVASFLACLIISRNPARYGFQVEPDAPLEFDTIDLDYQVDLRVLAEMIETPPSSLGELNPELRWGITPGGDYTLKVPAGKGAALRAGLASLPPQQRVRFDHHVVRKGETLGAIARKYRTTVEAIAEANRLRSIHRLSLNQELLIPAAGVRVAPPSRTGRAAQASQTPRATAPASDHVVKRGECLDQIARIYGVKVEDLLRWNNLKLGQTIYPGQSLKVGRGNTHSGGS
jgi:membrane-bound lytic murein transglycosylase D